ncbi:MAG: diguanylate cyclase [Gammaproteobacteria bacterium]|nr:diguanylate cyclase [Gammaproteobacteria bacterium]
MAEDLGARLLSIIAETKINLEDGRVINITASIGVSNFPNHADTWDKLLDIADSAMYLAKNAGRNQVVVGLN